MSESFVHFVTSKGANTTLCGFLSEAVSTVTSTQLLTCEECRAELAHAEMLEMRANEGPIELTVGSKVMISGNMFILTEMRLELDKAPVAILKSPVEFMERSRT